MPDVVSVTTQKSDSATLLIDIMKEQTLAAVSLRQALGGVQESLEAVLEVLESLNTHVIGLNVMMARQTHVEDALLAIQLGDPNANPPVPGREPTTVDRLQIIREYEERMEKEAEAAEIEERNEERREEALDMAVPAKDLPSIITSQPSMTRPHHPLPVIRPPTNPIP